MKKNNFLICIYFKEMKLSYMFLVGVLSFYQSKAQQNQPNAWEVKNPKIVSILYSDVNSGRSFSAVYGRGFNYGDVFFYAGLNLYVNSTSYKNSPSVYTTFFKEFYTKGINHIGLRAGVEKRVATISKNASISGFYDFQFKAGNIDNIYKLWVSDTPMYVHEEHENLEINSFENTIGVNLFVNINSQFRFRSQIGLGANFYSWRGEGAHSVSLKNLGSNWSFNRMFGFGIDYYLNRKLDGETRMVKRKYKEEMDFAKNSIALTYDDLQTGRNLNLTFQHYITNDILLYAGVKYNINSPLFDDYLKMDKSYYYKQFYAQNNKEHWGVKLGVERLHRIPNSNLQLFVFYDFQLMQCSVRNLAGLDFFATGITRGAEPAGSLGALISGDEVPINNPPTASYRIYGPVWSVENYIGAGFKLPLSDNLNFKMQGGVGYNFYMGPANYNTYVVNRYNKTEVFENVPWSASKSEISRMFSVGFEYKLNNK